MRLPFYLLIAHFFLHGKPVVEDLHFQTKARCEFYAKVYHSKCKLTLPTPETGL